MILRAVSGGLMRSKSVASETGKILLLGLPHHVNAGNVFLLSLLRLAYKF